MSNTHVMHGRLTKDCKSGYTSSEKAMIRFTVASDVGYGDNKHTNYADVVIIGKRAEGGLAACLTKGTHVYLAGELKIEQPREYQGKHYNQVTMFNPTLDLLGGGAKREADSQPSGGAPGGGDFDDSDIPF